jgi:hypothetical protein
MVYSHNPVRGRDNINSLYAGKRSYLRNRDRSSDRKVEGRTVEGEGEGSIRFSSALRT